MVRRDNHAAAGNRHGPGDPVGKPNAFGFYTVLETRCVTTLASTNTPKTLLSATFGGQKSSIFNRGETYPAGGVFLAVRFGRRDRPPAGLSRTTWLAGPGYRRGVDCGGLTSAFVRDIPRRLHGFVYGLVKLCPRQDSNLRHRL